MVLILLQTIRLFKTYFQVFDFFNQAKTAHKGLLIFFDRNKRVKHHFNSFIDKHDFSKELKIEKDDSNNWQESSLLYPIAQSLTLLRKQQNLSDEQKRMYANRLIDTYLRCGQALDKTLKCSFEVISSITILAWTTITVIFCVVVNKTVLITSGPFILVIFGPFILVIFVAISLLINCTLVDHLIYRKLNLANTKHVSDEFKKLETALLEFQKSDNAMVVNKILHANKVSKSNDEQGQSCLDDFDFENADPQMLLKQYASNVLKQAKEQLTLYTDSALNGQGLDDRPTKDVLHADELVHSISFFNALSMSTFGLVSGYDWQSIKFDNNADNFRAKIVWFVNSLNDLDGMMHDDDFEKLVTEMDRVAGEILHYFDLSIKDTFENKMTHFTPEDDSQSASDRLAELDYISKASNTD